MNHPLNCDRFESRIQRLLDERRDLERDQQLARHADMCAACSALLQEYQQLNFGIEQLRAEPRRHAVCQHDTASHRDVPDCRPNLIDRIVGRIVTTRPIGLALCAALAAMVLVAFSIGMNDLTRSDPPLTILTPGPDAYVDPAGANDLAKISPPAIGSFPKLDGEPNTLAVVAEEISQQFRPLDAYYQYSAELPGVRPLQCSVNWTIDLIQKSFGKQSGQSVPAKPDLGGFPELTLAMLSA